MLAGIFLFGQRERRPFAMRQKTYKLPLSGLLAAVGLAFAQGAHAQTTTTAPMRAASAISTSTSTTSATEAPEAVLTPDDLVRVVVQNNPALLASMRTREVATAAITSAGALINPRIEMSTGNNRPRLPSAVGGTVGGWGLSQFIENPSLREARIAGARHAERGSSQQVAVATNELVAQVKLRAFEYLLRTEEASAAAEALSILQQIKTRVRVRVDSGEAARFELIKANAEVINAEQKLQTAKLQIEQTALSINRLAAGALPQRWTLAGKLSDAQETLSIEQATQSALLNNPELKALQAALDRQEARVAEARASRFPGLELRLNQLRDPEIRQSALSVNLQIPLLDKRSGPIAEANAESARASVLLQGRKDELTQQVLIASKSIEIARSRVNALSVGAIPEAEAALSVAQAAYRFGERGILEVLDAQRLLRSINADLLDARYQMQAARIDLNFLAGRYADADINRRTANTAHPKDSK